MKSAGELLCGFPRATGVLDNSGGEIPGNLPANGEVSGVFESPIPGVVVNAASPRLCRKAAIESRQGKACAC